MRHPQLHALEEEGGGAGELVMRWAKVMKSRFRLMIVIFGDREYEGSNSRSSLDKGGVYRLRPNNSGFRIESQIWSYRYIVEEYITSAWTHGDSV